MNDIPHIAPLERSEGASQASSVFEEVFGLKPSGVWGSPGRVNLIGEHTDYNVGLCVPIALPHRTFVAVRPRTDDIVRVVSAMDPKNVATADLHGLRAGGVGGWAAYPVGVAWALREEGFSQVRGFDAAFVSCVPLGSGLSSSAAMTCSTALALDGVFSLGCAGTDEGRIRLIQAAMSAENDMAGASTGGLDQSASLRATAGHALLLDFRPELSAMDSARQEPFDLERFGLELLVVDIRAPHQLNDGQYAQRRSACESAAKLLGVANLRVLADRILSSADRQGALEEVLDRLPDETMRRRVRHVVTEIGRVPRFIEAFGRGDVDEAARLFDASHESLARDYEVTVPELDVAVEVARRMGAHGARMTGGGFGGSIIAMVDRGESRHVAEAIAQEFADRGFREPQYLTAVASASGCRED